MSESQTVTIKPHHFLDILKLYGKGIEEFVPDIDFGHDFYRIANLVLSGDIQITLSAEGDDICKPCRFFQNERCSDFVNFETEVGKDARNKTIDRRLFNVLGFEEGNVLTAYEFAKIAREKLNEENIREIWQERPEEETKLRTEYLLKGINKYIERFDII